MKTMRRFRCDTVSGACFPVTLQIHAHCWQTHGERSEDASGQDRRQILDANWTVVDQNIAPGERIDEGDVVLQVLKKEEAQSQGICQ